MINKVKSGSLVLFLMFSLFSCTNLNRNNLGTENLFKQTEINQDFSDLDQEYSQFKTKALTETYLKKKMDKWLSNSNYSKKLLREVEYAKYKHPDVLKNVVAEQPPIFDGVVDDSSIIQKRSEPSFDNYIKYIDPHPHDVTAIDATNVTNTSFTANWNFVDNAAGYNLFIDGSATPIVLGKVTNYNINNLPEKSSHTYYLKARNLAGDGSSSNNINVTLLALLQIAIQPTNVTQTSFTANWDAVDGAINYKLYLDGNLVYTGLDTNYTVNNLLAGSNHTYKVVITTAQETFVSNEISVTLQALLLGLGPTALAATNITDTSFTANWTTFPDALGYSVYVNGNLVQSIDDSSITNSTITYSGTPLVANTLYNYYVKAKLANEEESQASNIISVLTKHDAFKIDSPNKNEILELNKNDGSFVLSWTMSDSNNNKSLQAQKFNSDGTVASSEFEVVKYSNAAHYHDYQKIGILPNGDFVILWTNQSPDSYYSAVFAKKYNSNGTPASSEFQVNTFSSGDQSTPEIAVSNDGTFVILWTNDGMRPEDGGENYGIYGQKYNSSASPIGSEFRFSSSQTSSGPPTVKFLNDGSFISAWEIVNFDIYESVTQVKKEGGSEYQLAIGTAPKIKMGTDGKFIISWNTSCTFNGSYDVCTFSNQKFNADATPYGSQFELNTQAIGMLNNGKYVVVSQNYLQYMTEIYAQIYNSDGTPDGNKFIVAVGTQDPPSISVKNNNEFIINWVDFDPNLEDGTYYIFGKRYDSDGNVL